MDSDVEIMKDVSIPDDLKTFLETNEKLIYDVNKCKVGNVTLIPLDGLKIYYVPVQTLPESIKGCVDLEEIRCRIYQIEMLENILKKYLMFNIKLDISFY